MRSSRTGHSSAVFVKDHDFLYIPEWDHARMKEVPKGHVPLGNRNITLEEWKAVITKLYVDFE
jgi:hypothetical protein